MSVFFGLKHGPSRMNDGGAIVCTSSAAGQVQLPGFAAYGASKAALNALVRSAALELGPRRIRVNAVCPGGFASEMAPYDAAEDARLGKLSPLGRAFASVEEIVGVYHLLVAAEGGFITGQLIHVDGGVNLGFTASVIDAL